MAKVEKNKKENKHFFKDFKAELKKVIWPSTKQVVNNTTAVISIVLITALIVFVLDLAFETLNTQGVNRLKSVVYREDTTNNVVNNSIENNIIDNNIINDNSISE